MILALQGKRDDSDIVSTVLGALLAVILAEAYADYVGTMIGTGLRPTWPELRSQLALTFTSLLAVVPPIALLMLGVYGVFSLDAGFTAAKISGIVVIGAYAYVANRRSGLSAVGASLPRPSCSPSPPGSCCSSTTSTRTSWRSRGRSRSGLSARPGSPCSPDRSNSYRARTSASRRAP